MTTTHRCDLVLGAGGPHKHSALRPCLGSQGKDREKPKHFQDRSCPATQRPHIPDLPLRLLLTSIVWVFKPRPHHCFLYPQETQKSLDHSFTKYLLSTYCGLAWCWRLSSDRDAVFTLTESFSQWWRWTSHKGQSDKLRP